MRNEVISAVRSLSDKRHQKLNWGRYDAGVEYYDDLSLNVHVLYDDCMVLPDPRASVPDILQSEEVSAFLQLEQSLGPMIDDLGDEPDSVYVEDPRWDAVVQAARQLLH
jgi:hypothetical protein